MAEEFKTEKFEMKSNTVNATDVRKKDGFYVTRVLKNTDAATAANYGLFFIARHPMEIMRVSIVYATASTSGTLQLERLQGTEAKAAGDTLLGSTFDMSATANTVQTKEGSDLTASRQLKEGDRLALIDGGTLTNQNDLVVTIYCKPLGQGDYR